MPVSVVGISHHTAPVDVRERFAVPSHKVGEVLLRLTGEGPGREGVLLSTCNRTELYIHAAEGAPLTMAEDILSEQAGLSRSEAQCYLYSHRGRRAVEHLYRVVSSLDSMVLGEAQIQGQVRASYQLASELGTSPPVVGPVLGRLFTSALGVGGRVRTETQLGSGAASVASAAVDLARKIFGSLRGRRAVVVGAGEMSELALQCFAAEGLGGIVVANRNPENAEDLARRVGGRAIPYAEIGSVLGDADILVTATGAPHRVVTRPFLETALPGGPDRPLFILDIALPRDVDEDVAGLKNVFVYDIDDLQQIVGGNLERRRQEIPAAERIIREEVERYWGWLASLDVVPLIRELRDRGEAVRQQEVERALRRLEHLGETERHEVEALTRRLINKLLHEPTVRLREAAGNGRGPFVVDAARYLFELEADRSRDERDERDEQEEQEESPSSPAD